mmetsp:Transcript_80274/g.260007  ORF Transcript_80274/g.260007 Transcript_80274/m.260007 type:complete len:353 (-) Transcript_80274:1581-2639(-)
MPVRGEHRQRAGGDQQDHHRQLPGRAADVLPQAAGVQDRGPHPREEHGGAHSAGRCGQVCAGQPGALPSTAAPQSTRGLHGVRCLLWRLGELLLPGPGIRAPAGAARLQLLPWPFRADPGPGLHLRAVARRRALLLRAGRLCVQPDARAGLPAPGAPLLHGEDRLPAHLQQRHVHRGLPLPGARGRGRQRGPGGAGPRGRLGQARAGGLVHEHRRARAAHLRLPLQPDALRGPAGDPRGRRALGLHHQGERRHPAAEAPLRVRRQRLHSLQAAGGEPGRAAHVQPPPRHAHRPPHDLQGDAAGLVRAAPGPDPRAGLRGDHLRHPGHDRLHGQARPAAGLLPGHGPAHRQPR